MAPVYYASQRPSVATHCLLVGKVPEEQVFIRCPELTGGWIAQSKFKAALVDDLPAAAKAFDNLHIGHASRNLQACFMDPVLREISVSSVSVHFRN